MQPAQCSPSPKHCLQTRSRAEQALSASPSLCRSASQCQGPRLPTSGTPPAAGMGHEGLPGSWDVSLFLVSPFWVPVAPPFPMLRSRTLHEGVREVVDPVRETHTDRSAYEGDAGKPIPASHPTHLVRTFTF